MAEGIEITIVVDAPLVQYFEEGIRKDHVDATTGQLLSEFLANLLGETNYPMSARLKNEREIHLSYRPKAFADPIF